MSLGEMFYSPMVEELKAKVKGLREALAIYGGHIGSCSTDVCECGFRNVWKEQGIQEVVDGKRTKNSEHTDLRSRGI